MGNNSGEKNQNQNNGQGLEISKSDIKNQNEFNNSKEKEVLVESFLTQKTAESPPEAKFINQPNYESSLVKVSEKLNNIAKEASMLLNEDKQNTSLVDEAQVDNSEIIYNLKEENRILLEE